MKKYFVLLTVVFLILINTILYGQESVYKSVPIGNYGGKLNPDLSLVVDMQGLFTNAKSDQYGKMMLKGVELVFGSYLYPGIRGDVVFTFEQEYKEKNDVETEIHFEEAYISFLELPLGLQLVLGRKLIDFGKLNQNHPHHWHFVDTPPAIERIFGDHPWADDLVNISFLIPNPLDIYFKESFSVINGKPLGHHHEEEENGDEEHHHHGIHWSGRVFNSRTSIDFPWINTVFGYSHSWDENNESAVQGLELTYKYQFPGYVYRRLKLQNEYLWGKSEEKNIYPGLYSMIALALNQYLELGLRYDAIFENEELEIENWAGNMFATYYFTHSFYLRGQYQHKSSQENTLYLHLSWGFGPHSHRLED